MPKDKKVTSLPSIEYLIKSYSNSSDGNDQKAVNSFNMFETKEKVSRLKNELMWIRDGIVAEETCTRVLGVKRKAKYESYDNWAKYVMIWISQHKK